MSARGALRILRPATMCTVFRVFGLDSQPQISLSPLEWATDFAPEGIHEQKTNTERLRASIVQLTARAGKHRHDWGKYQDTRWSMTSATQELPSRKTMAALVIEAQPEQSVETCLATVKLASPALSNNAIRELTGRSGERASRSLGKSGHKKT